MAAAAEPHAEWMSTTAIQAEDAAIQAKSAAAAYEAAFAATVPPPLIAINRAQLTVLNATNFFGQNTAAIMATEAQYAEMWAQDAAAMYCYAGSSATASQMTPFSLPPQTTNPAGTPGQFAAVAQLAGTHTQTLPQLMSAVPQSLQSLASSPTAAHPAVAAAFTSTTSDLATIDKYFTSSLAPPLLYSIGAIPELLGAQGYLLPQAVANLLGGPGAAPASAAGVGWEKDSLGPRASLVGSGGSSGIAADTGRAELVGRLSVPQAWPSPGAAFRTTAAIVPHGPLEAGSPATLSAGEQGSVLSNMAPAALAADGEAGLLGNLAPPALAGRGPVGTGSTSGTGGAAAVEASATTENVSNIFVICEPDAE